MAQDEKIDILQETFETKEKLINRVREILQSSEHE